MGWKTMAAAECRRQMQGGRPATFLDVRTPGEFSRLHAAGAKLMPLDELNAPSVAAGQDAGATVFVICQSGARAAKACQKLQDAGLTNVISIEGGTVAWEKAGLPVERGTSGVISLERQVRIGAGGLVLLGVVLAVTIHWGFLGIAAFVGAGLMFSGVTNYCGMAMVLAKMPWNR